MSNFELIDDYLMNRLSEQEKLKFEQELTLDNALKTDVELQRHILEGVKKARVAELKAMLNNVPVGGGLSSGLTAGKLAATVVAAGVITLAVYMYVKPSDETKENNVSPAKTELADSTVEKLTIVTPNEKPVEKKDDPTVVVPSKDKGNVARKKESTKPAQQPALDVTNPSDELIEDSRKDEPVAQGQKSTVSTSSIVVETSTSNKKYNFHYQFASGKLMLYGSFDKSLYEILEIHGEQHTVFLYFKDNYYLLDEKQDTVTQLTPIKDAALLKKLREYRGR